MEPWRSSLTAFYTGDIQLHDRYGEVLPQKSATLWVWKQHNKKKKFSLVFKYLSGQPDSFHLLQAET